MSHFRLLAQPENYVAHDWDLIADDEARAHWIDLFETHFREALKHAAKTYGNTVQLQIEHAAKDFQEVIDALRADPKALGEELTLITLVRKREEVLRSQGLHDPFGHAKSRENASAEKLYPDVVRELHAMGGRDRWLHLLRAVFAGNVFDLGSPAVMNTGETSPDFTKAVKEVRERPWLVDDFDAFAARLDDAPPTPWARALVLVDNAGPDFILGMLPLARELALGGTQIILAANEKPSLNDITVDEVIEVVERLARADRDMPALLEAGMFEVASTGNDIPLIDFSDVTDELNHAAEDTDLLIIEGMGRAVESNWETPFTVDTLRLALLKDPLVAAKVDGEVYDCVCKFTPKPE